MHLSSLSLESGFVRESAQSVENRIGVSFGSAMHCGFASSGRSIQARIKNDCKKA